MLRATFLAHSGFLIELPSVTLLFDWWKGELPPLRQGVPLLVFASHSHEDHFSPAIFNLPAHSFLLGHDITPRRLSRLNIPAETTASCRFLKGNETCAPLPGVTVETLPSTDEGVAFLVTADGKTVFHAGDLNWWHWEGEGKAWNRNMEVNFLRYIQPLHNRSIDLALLPLDPRQEADGFRGFRTYLEIADIRRAIPMHQWENFGFTEEYLRHFPEHTEKTVPVTEHKQIFEF